MLHALEFDAIDWKFWKIFSIITMFVQIFVMTALRSHYSVDMFTGAIIAHYIWIMSERYAYLIDWYIFGIPLYKRITKKEHEDLNTED